MSEMFLKEAFKIFLLSYGLEDYCIMNNLTFTSLPNRLGIITKGDIFVVYQTDEKGQVSKSKEFDDQFKAYYFAGKQFGLNFGLWLKSRDNEIENQRTI